MNRTGCFFALLILSLFACNNKPSKTAYFSKLSGDSLLVQLVTIDNSRDTIIRTVNGALIAINSGSFSSGLVQLEIKEAYSLSSMILAGLTTESDGKPLSSGGMISVEAKDKNVVLVKPVSISLPADTLDPKMLLYRGKKNKDGRMNWEDPQPLKKDNLTGQLLFRQMCATCHSMDKILTGPALRGVEGRGPWNRPNLHRWVRNPAAFIPGTCYTRELQKQFGQIMPSFPNLTDVEIDAIFDYIRDEDGKGISYRNTYDPTCDDSCYRYDSLRMLVEERLSQLTIKRENHISDNGERINLEMKYELPDPPLAENGNIVRDIDPDRVLPKVYPSVYYQFSITSFGWYNVDKLLEYGDAGSELSVETKGTYRMDMSVFIAIPAYRVFAEGGPLEENGTVFGFYTKDGKMPLPGGTKLFVFAVSEVNGGIAFDWKEFVSEEKQHIVLEPRVVTKKEFNRTVKKFKLDGVRVRVADSKNAGQIRKADREVNKIREELERLRPKNCDCRCFGEQEPIVNEKVDTTAGQ